MTVQCLQCSKLDLQKHKQHATQGFGKCPHDAVGIFVNIRLERECKKFKPGAADVVAAREVWATKL